MLVLLTSCSSTLLSRKSEKIVNSSSLYDPPSVTLIEGHSYQFSEGVLEGRGQRFYSQWSYTKALSESLTEKDE